MHLLFRGSLGIGKIIHGAKSELRDKQECEWEHSRPSPVILVAMGPFTISKTLMSRDGAR